MVFFVGGISLFALANPCEEIGFVRSQGASSVRGGGLAHRTNKALRDLIEFKDLTQKALAQILKPESKLEGQLIICGVHCLKLNSQTDITFKIIIDSKISDPEVYSKKKSKILKIPSLDFLDSTLTHKDNTHFKDTLRYWLVGHELHPYFYKEGPIMIKPVQEVAFKAYTQAVSTGAKSFLHVSPTGVGKTLVMVRAIMDRISHADKHEKIIIVLADQVQLVNQLYQAIQARMKERERDFSKVNLIKWNNHKKSIRFKSTLELALKESTFTVLVMTSQSLKARIKELPLEIYQQLTDSLNSVFIDEAHHFGAPQTNYILSQILQKNPSAFLYGATATPEHYQAGLRDLFDKVHWSYLNTEEGNFFKDHLIEDVLKQLSKSIDKGEITPFNGLYFIADILFEKDTKKKLFVSEGKKRVLNPDYYERLADILYPLLTENKKGFIVTATVREAERLTQFLSDTFLEIDFSSYHYKKSSEERQAILRHSRASKGSHYIVTVRSLDEGLDLPHLSAYVDLNVNVPITKMIHRIGRVLRLYPGKLSPDIMFLIDYRDEQVARDLLSVLDVIKHVFFHRESSVTTTNKDPLLSYKGPLLSYNEGVLRRDDLSYFKELLKDTVQRFWINSRVTQKNLPSIEEFIAVVIEQKDIKTKKEYDDQRRIDSSLKRFPSTPHRVYANFKWPGRGKRLSRLAMPPVEEFITVVIEQKDIKTAKEYVTARRTDPLLKKFPSEPTKVYPGFQWPGRGGYVKKLNVPPVEEFIAVVIEQKDIKTQVEYIKARRIDPLLKKFPSEPTKVYPGFQWPGRGRYVTKLNVPPVEEFIAVVIEQKDIKTQVEYIKARRIDPSLKRLFPSEPISVYSGFQWPGRGRVRLRKSDMPSLEEFITLVVEQKDIKTAREYAKARRTDTFLKRFPSNPDRTYSGFQWPGRFLKITYQDRTNKPGLTGQDQQAKTSTKNRAGK